MPANLVANYFKRATVEARRNMACMRQRVSSVPISIARECIPNGSSFRLRLQPEPGDLRTRGAPDVRVAVRTHARNDRGSTEVHPLQARRKSRSPVQRDHRMTICNRRRVAPGAYDVEPEDTPHR